MNDKLQFKSAYADKLSIFCKDIGIKFPEELRDLFLCFYPPFDDDYLFMNIFFDSSFEYYAKNFAKFEEQSLDVLRDFRKQIDWDYYTKYHHYYRIIDKTNPRYLLIFAEVSVKNRVDETNNDIFEFLEKNEASDNEYSKAIGDSASWVDEFSGEELDDIAKSYEEQNVSEDINIESEKTFFPDERTRDILGDKTLYYLMDKNLGMVFFIDKDCKFKVHIEYVENKLVGCMLVYKNKFDSGSERQIVFRQIEPDSHEYEIFSDADTEATILEYEKFDGKVAISTYEFFIAIKNSVMN